MRESREAAAGGDYSKPASRRAVLGRMHEVKLRQWEQCRAECGGGGELYYFDAGAGRTGVSARGGETLYLRPISLGWWAVEDERGELDRLPDYEEALQEAHGRLSPEVV